MLQRHLQVFMACSQSLEFCLYFAAFFFLAVMKKLHFVLPFVELLLHVPTRDKGGWDFCLTTHTQIYAVTETSKHWSTNFIPLLVQEVFVSFGIRGQYFRSWTLSMELARTRVFQMRKELSGTMARTEPCILGFYLSHKGGCNRRDNSSPSVQKQTTYSKSLTCKRFPLHAWVTMK